jgi:hypothetical protein
VHRVAADRQRLDSGAVEPLRRLDDRRSGVVPAALGLRLGDRGEVERIDDQRPPNAPPELRRRPPG